MSFLRMDAKKMIFFKIVCICHEKCSAEFENDVFVNESSIERKHTLQLLHGHTFAIYIRSVELEPLHVTALNNKSYPSTQVLD